jgi:Tfp pilus assembly protein PilF
MEEVMSKFVDVGIEKNYEFYFNLAYFYLATRDTQNAIINLREAYEKAKKEDSYVDD